ncbi:hypothetical protein EGW08_008240 [Elysia chlorotica]|uniref:Serine/Arginine-related protein 53 n=1 Tax=Elysia chlorotica TaxID=188477 RepID=A0A3S1HQ73_ELYCH|nr:hypothetical protein EGW08_008240 [Elysia chlorotica]
MGKSKYRSDESDEDRASVRKHKKKSKNRSGRSRSRSGSDSGNSHVSSSRSKKSKKRHGRSSMSQSPERGHGRSSRRSRRSRSRSYDRHYSSSRRGRRSQSRSVSPSKRGRHSRSPYHSRSRSPSTRKSRRSRSASRSRGQRRRSRSYSGSRSHSRRSSPETRGDASTDTKSRKGHSELKSVSSLTPAQQAEERMRLALKAAVAADQKLRQLPLAEPGGGEGPSAVEGGQPKFSSYEESQSFADSVAAIDSGNFRQALFKSSRSGKPQESPGHDLVPSHDDAIFGSLAVTGFTIKPDPDTRPLQLDPDSIMHQSLFCNAEDKLDQWIQRLAQLRRRKLEGDAL